MAKQRKADVPDNVSEEYYQISEEILSSFSKYRPPVDLFMFRDDIAQLYPLFRKGQRLTNEQVDQVQQLCHDASLFVSRSDHHIYVEHIAKQADLVLQDANLKPKEIADILFKALEFRLEHFFEQPVMSVFEPLYRDVMVFTEYISQDHFRTKQFMRRLHTGEATLVKHSLNVLACGMWLFFATLGKEELKRRQLDRTAIGLLLLDSGMSKIPAFILNKKTALKSDERDKILLHPLAGAKMMQKFNLSFDELNQAVMQHHERMDGSGYPQKLKAATISKVGRMAAVADSFAAMITERAYAKAMEPKAAAQALAQDKEKYDPKFTVPLFNAYLTGDLAAPYSETVTGAGQNSGSAAGDSGSEG